MEKEDCVICLEIIDKQSDNYRIDLCDRCKYIIHTDCWEKYIEYRGSSQCLICNSFIEYKAQLSYSNRIVYYLSESANIRTRNLYNIFKLYCSISIFVLVFSFIILSVMIISVSYS